MLATLNAIKGTKNRGHCKKGLPGNTIYIQKKKKSFCLEQTPSWYGISLCQLCAKEGNSLIIPMRQTNTNPLGVSKKKEAFQHPLVFKVLFSFGNDRPCWLSSFRCIFFWVITRGYNGRALTGIQHCSNLESPEFDAYAFCQKLGTSAGLFTSPKSCIGYYFYYQSTYKVIFFW